ncbi:TonB-dependent receptor [Paludibacter sp. 221]|uniref:SusC/RagA family TonB-linked outer membrane protein n=1 Tax=Paludibacter sp. 221 TaxID=2302939 RepID=UPI0013D1D49B
MNKKNLFSRLFSIVCMLFLTVGIISAQVSQVSGKITDEAGEAIIGATIMVKGTTAGTVTDFDGNYNITVPSGGNTLLVSYVGMQTQELVISSSVMNITLRDDSQVLDDVVVTGYGTTKKRDLVTSVASVGADQLKDIPVTSAGEALQGKLAGVSVTTTEGSPDADVKIRVRGGSSLTQSSEPLYIVDGFPVSNINDIPPGDIQSMDVLKDAAATAIYGAQGANGVIIITTKDSSAEGDKNSLSVDYSGYIGWKKIAKRYEMLNSRDFTLMQYEYAYLAKGKSNLGSNFATYFDQYYHDNNKNGDYQTPINELLDYWGGVEATDWQDKTFGRTGFNSNHNVSVSGGNKNANFNASYSRIDDKAIMEGSNYIRNNLSLKAKFKPLKDLTIGFTARYTNTEVLGSGANTADDAGSKTESRVRNAIAYTPVELLTKDNPVAGVDEESFGSLYDPITTINHNYKYKTDNKWTMNGYLTYKFAKRFTFRSDVGYDSRHVETERFYGPTTYYSREGDGKTNAGGESGYSSAFLTNNYSSKFRNSNTLEYKQKFNKEHNLSVLLGEETIVNKGETTTFVGSGYQPYYSGEEIFTILNQASYFSFKNYIDPKDNMLSFFGRVNYDYKGRYYLTGTMRADASTRFAKENQWGYFPSAAAAWRVSDEPFMAGSSNWLSNLKARLSYGVAGNNNVALGYLYPGYLSSSLNYIEDFGSILTTGGSDVIAPNPALKWETTTTRNFGIDYGFFGERLSGAVDIYWNTTTDLILKYKMMIGYNYQYRNVGSTENKGAELSIRGVILDKRSSRLSYGLVIDANISANRNTVKSLGELDEFPVSTAYFSANYLNNDTEFKVEPGESIGRIYGYKTNGWYTTDDFVSYNPSSDKWLDESGNTIETILGTARPGMMKLDGEKGETPQRTILGSTMPLFTGGFAISAHVGGESWGRLDMNANFTYSYGNKILNLSALDYSTIFDKSKLRNNTSNVAYGSRYSLFTESGSYIPASAQTDASNLVTGENYAVLSNQLTESNSGATIYNPVMTSIAITDNIVEDGSFLRLSSLTIGYSLPDKWINKAYISNARIFVTGSNLFCLTKYTGSDPEVDTGTKRNPLAVGVDFSAYPKSRGFNIGLNLSF